LQDYFVMARARRSLKKNPTCAVLIAGGGLVGLAQALATADLGDGDQGKIVLVDQMPLTPKSKSQDLRAFAITAASRRMLTRLGVWEKIAKYAQPVSKMLISDGPLRSVARPPLLELPTLETSKDGLEAASIIENRYLVQALTAQVKKDARIRVIAPDKVTGLETGPGSVTVQLEKSGEIEARLIVAADGARSGVRRMVGIKTMDWDYGQSGIVATIGLDRPHKGRAIQHFLPAGPFAMLPLVSDKDNAHRGSLVWSEGAGETRRLLALGGEDFLEALQLRLGLQFGQARLLAGPQSFPLGMTLARGFVAPRVALIGDAAHKVHPLAGQGANLGFKDVAALSQTLIEAQRLGEDFGSLLVLERYQTWRRFDVVTNALAMDGMNRVFSNEIPGLKQLRDVGLALVDRVLPLKSMMTREAAGETGRVPVLMRVGDG
jgi:2-octaprenyl-6-methoxyphenol hydroxylase